METQIIISNQTKKAKSGIEFSPRVVWFSLLFLFFGKIDTSFSFKCKEICAFALGVSPFSL
jgi:hypothetical protein